MIDEKKLVQALYDACDKDAFKNVPKWIIDIINQQPKVEE